MGFGVWAVAGCLQGGSSSHTPGLPPPPSPAPFPNPRVAGGVPLPAPASACPLSHRLGRQRLHQAPHGSRQGWDVRHRHAALLPHQDHAKPARTPTRAQARPRPRTGARAQARARPARGVRRHERVPARHDLLLREGPGGLLLHLGLLPDGRRHLLPRQGRLPLLPSTPPKPGNAVTRLVPNYRFSAYPRDLRLRTR